MHLRLPRSTACVAFVLAGLAACSGESPAGSSSGTTGSGGSGGGCAADEHLVDAGVCDTTLSWEAAGTLTPARHHHTTFVIESKSGPFLYVAGGFTGSSFLKDVTRAAIQPDGSLAAWEPQTPLPSPLRAGHMLVVGTGHVLMLGGMTSAGEIADVVSAPVDDAGSIGAWTAQASLPFKRMHGAAALDGKTIYVVGGLVDGTAVANVERATLNADGTVTAWEELAPLPAPRSHHPLVVDGGHLYAIGGLDGAPAGAYTDHKDVLRAAIQADGTLGEWMSIATLPVGLDTASTVVHHGHLYLVGGIEGSLYVDHVRRAALLDDHGLGPWEDAPPLPKGRGHVHQTPLYKSWVYSVGGSIKNLVAIPDVVRGTFQ